MADITMCDDEDCRLKDTCYRYLATPCPYRQSYFYTSPLVSKSDEEEDECKEYWDINKDGK